MTPFRCLTVRVFVVAFLLISLSAILRAQSNDARITGIVTDPSKAVIPGAKVDLINVDTGVRYPTVTNGSGIYSVSGQVGSYRLEVEHVGFKTVIAPGIVLHTQDALEINFEMAIGSASESVTVNSGATNDNPAVSMTVSREFVENMPLNGRSFQDLIQLAPGVAAATGGQGYYSVNGQRTDSNNYTVDGVSATLGGYNNSSAGGFASGLSGSSPAQTVLGTTQSLASIDSLQEFKIQTSGYTAEYGRNTGGQVEFTTRSGTNDIHGTLFEYLRNTAFDANSFGNGYFDDPKTAERQNDFGGTIGGPLIIPKLYNGRGETFYFFSYEGLRLLLPNFETEYVPTKAFRQWASLGILPVLNSAPPPNANSPGNQDGCTIPDPATGQPAACDALFSYGFSYPSELDNMSVRVDHTFGSRLHAFVRYADTPSSETNGAENVTREATNVHNWTVGLTANLTDTLLNEFRFNYSHDGEEEVLSQRAIAGSVPLARNVVIPAQYDSAYARGFFRVRVPGSQLNTTAQYSGGGTTQHQYQIVDSFTWTRGKHGLKFGGDWRRLTPTFTADPYQSVIYSQSLSDIQQGNASTVQVAAGSPGQPIFDDLSLYVQDHWKVSPRLSVDYGLRWEFNPAPGPSNGEYPVTLTTNNLAIAQLTPLGAPPYKTLYDKFAPRFGFAWNAIHSPRHALTVRGGVGIFFDTGQQAIGSGYINNYPYTATAQTQTEVPLPLSDSALAPPSLSLTLTPPYPYLYVTSPDLTLPYTEQWNLSVDEMINANNTLTVSYTGNNGRKLLFTTDYGDVPGNPAFPNGLTFTNNASQSSYDGLQVQDVGRIAQGLDLVASFTLAHALDNLSTDNFAYAPIWGNSDSDLRRVLNLALNYQTLHAGSNRWTHALTRGWLLANRFSAQSGYPIRSISQTTSYLPNGAEVQYFPDLIPGVPIYLHGRAAEVNGESTPGGWRLNPAAFACVPTNLNRPCLGTPIRQGTLGRNYVRNPSFWTLNTAVQRSFPIYEQAHLNFRAEAFNILNHPNLEGPDTYLPDSTFGQLIYGEITTIGSKNALYSMGAARSLQLSLRLQF